jgi:hypothetical protein
MEGLVREQLASPSTQADSGNLLQTDIRLPFQERIRRKIFLSDNLQAPQAYAIHYTALSLQFSIPPSQNLRTLIPTRSPTLILPFSDPGPSLWTIPTPSWPPTWPGCVGYGTELRYSPGRLRRIIKLTSAPAILHHSHIRMAYSRMGSVHTQSANPCF